jgi:hypothetical protein
VKNCARKLDEKLLDNLNIRLIDALIIRTLQDTEQDTVVPLQLVLGRPVDVKKLNFKKKSSLIEFTL